MSSSSEIRNEQARTIQIEAGYTSGLRSTAQIKDACPACVATENICGDCRPNSNGNSLSSGEREQEDQDNHGSSVLKQHGEHAASQSLPPRGPQRLGQLAKLLSVNRDGKLRKTEQQQGQQPEVSATKMIPIPHESFTRDGKSDGPRLSQPARNASRETRPPPLSNWKVSRATIAAGVPICTQSTAWKIRRCGSPGTKRTIPSARRVAIAVTAAAMYRLNAIESKRSLSRNRLSQCCQVQP